MTAPDYTLMLLDRYESHFAGAVLQARDDTDTQIYTGCLSAIQAVRSQVRMYRDTFDKDATFTLEGVIKRLDKAQARTTEAYVRDQIRLACNQLRRLCEPAPVDTEPIDIFIV